MKKKTLKILDDANLNTLDEMQNIINWQFKVKNMATKEQSIAKESKKDIKKGIKKEIKKFYFKNCNVNIV